MSLDAVPLPVLSMIVSWLPLGSVVNFSSVSKTTRSCANQENVWRDLFEQEFGSIDDPHVVEDKQKLGEWRFMYKYYYENSGDHQIKVVVVGNAMVGKTSLLIKYTTNEFPIEYIPTVFDNYTNEIKKGSMRVSLQLWDTAGQEEYDRLRPLSYPGANLVLICFSTVSQISFESVQAKWIGELSHYIPDVPIVLLGTKTDLREANLPDKNQENCTPITKEMGNALARRIKALKYLEVSAKENIGVRQVFDEAINTVVRARRRPIPKKLMKLHSKESKNCAAM